MVETLIIEGTDDIPSVILDKDNNLLEFSGRFLHDDVHDFFSRIFDWFDDYEKSPNEKTVLNLKMRYFNTAASKAFLDLMVRLEELNELGNDVLIKWYYPEDDPDMEEAGEEYAEMVDLPFEYIPYSIND